MPFQRWQVGLDIQDSSVRALALQRMRQGWQLRHWWASALSPGVMQEGRIQQPQHLSTLLMQWRRQLPRSISLRIAFPVQLVLQHSIGAPDRRLKEPERAGFIAASAARQFPLDSQSLVLDYRTEGVNDGTLLLTAARRAELERWQSCLAAAGLYPQAVDIAPCALRRMALAAEVPATALLLHRLDSGWLWVAPAAAPFRYGLLALNTGAEVEEHPTVLTQRCHRAFGEQVTIACSGMGQTEIPQGMLSWSPLQAFRYLQPPLPAKPTEFTLAGGLALRQDDR